MVPIWDGRGDMYDAANLDQDVFDNDLLQKHEDLLRASSRDGDGDHEDADGDDGDEDKDDYQGGGHEGERGHLDGAKE